MEEAGCNLYHPGLWKSFCSCQVRGGFCRRVVMGQLLQARQGAKTFELLVRAFKRSQPLQTCSDRRRPLMRVAASVSTRQP